jgi:hypothetical protein
MDKFPTRQELIDRICSEFRSCSLDVYCATRRELELASTDALHRIAAGTWKMIPDKPTIEVMP